MGGLQSDMDESSYYKMGGGVTGDGRGATALPRASDGWTMGGFQSDLDESSYSKMGGG